MNTDTLKKIIALFHNGYSSKICFGYINCNCCDIRYLVLNMITNFMMLSKSIYSTNLLTESWNYL